MNYFFKYLIPQLLEYFKQDKEVLSLFIPQIIVEKYQDNLTKISNNEK